MTFDEDKIRRSLRRNLDPMNVPRDVPSRTVRRGRTRRMTWMAGVASVVVIALLGGIAGGMTLLRDEAETDVAPQPEDGRNFARYFFEVDEGDASASGTLEVDIKRTSLCLEVMTRDIKASHLLVDDPSRPAGAGRWSVAFTFFDPEEDEEGSGLPPSGTHCFRDEQLETLEYDGFLVDLVNDPEKFRVDFHRGPNDDPGLVAELTAIRMAQSCDGQRAPRSLEDQPLGFLPSAARSEGGQRILPIRFPDGSTAELVYPNELSLEQLYVRPDIVGKLGTASIAPIISFDGIPFGAAGPLGCAETRDGQLVPMWGHDGRLFVTIRLGDWYVTLFERQTRLALWAKHLRAGVDENGWLHLAGDAELKLGPELDPGEAELMFSDRRNILTLKPLPCEPADDPPPSTLDGNQRFVSFCVGNVDINAQGEPGFVQQVAEGLRVRDLRTRFPLDHYESVP